MARHSLQECASQVHTPTHGESCIAQMIEIFGDFKSTVLADEFVALLDGCEPVAVDRALNDFKGVTNWERTPFHVGKMPTLDEFRPRVRYHAKQISEAGEIRNKTVLLPAPKPKEKPKFLNRPIIAKDKTLDEFRAGASAKIYPVGASFDWKTGNVYGPKGEVR